MINRRNFIKLTAITGTTTWRGWTAPSSGWATSPRTWPSGTS